jgi:hypothetical protein
MRQTFFLCDSPGCTAQSEPQDDEFGPPLGWGGLTLLFYTPEREEFHIRGHLCPIHLEAVRALLPDPEPTR